MVTVRDFIRNYLNDIVIITAIVIGLFGGVILANTGQSLVVVAIFFGLAITSFTYRFLGGIDENTSFKLGAIKASGTIACLFGSIWLIVSLARAQSSPITLPEGFGPDHIYFFDAAGEPVEKTFQINEGGEQKELVFAKIDNSTFSDVPRDYRLHDARLYIMTLRDSIDLGFIDKRIPLSYDLLLPKHSLYIGLHLSEQDSSGGRKDSRNAIQYLFRVLKETEDLAMMELAVNRLYFLQNGFDRPDQFELLLTMIHRLRSSYNMHLELASTHLNYSYKFAPDPREHQRFALKHYLEFLSTRQSTHPKLADKKKQVSIRINELMDISLRRDAFVKENRQQIKLAVERHQRARLKDFAEQLPLMEESASKR